LALKNGIGYFSGVENVFRFALKRNAVFSIGKFSIERQSPREQVKLYSDALATWLASPSERADLVFIVHPRTPRYEPFNVYYACKTVLLREGVLSQSVTREVIDDRQMFEWSIANIALGAFAKLGGVPWVVSGDSAERELVIGVGRSDLYNRESRITERYLGFTACFSARGAFKFMSLGEVTSSRIEYLQALEKVLRDSLERARNDQGQVTSITIHVPKEMGIEELETINRAVAADTRNGVVSAWVVS
jgi:hypothetical protein